MKKILHTSFYVSMLALFSFLIVCYGTLLTYHYMNPAQYLDQSYPKPFVTRALSVWLMKFLYKQTNYDYLYIFKYMDITWLVLSGWFFHKYINSFFNNNTFSKVMSFSLYFIIPFNVLLPRYLPVWVPVDFMGLLFLTMGLYFLRVKNIFWFYIVLLVGTFNRETTIVLIAMFAYVNWGEIPLRKTLMHMSVQVSIWLSIKLLLSQYFISSPGRSFEYQLPANLHFLSIYNTDFYNLPLFDFEYLFRCVSIASPFAFIYLLIIIFWKKLDNQFLRRTLLASIPFFMVIPIVGFMFELRLYCELTPIVLMPVIYIIARIMNDQPVISNQ